MAERRTASLHHEASHTGTLASVARGWLFLLAAISGFAAEPGKFDYYLLSLSWSPDFCAGHATAPECKGTKKYGFVVHGLWPQNERGYPQNCGGPPFNPGKVPASLPAIMPSGSLQSHEWTKHGTCSGLGQMEYFQTVERAFRSVNIPAPYQQPLQNIQVPPQQIKDNFRQANSSFPEQGVSVQCSGRYLSEVRVCLGKDLQPRACAASIRDTCRTPTVIMRPLR